MKDSERILAVHKLFDEFLVRGGRISLLCQVACTSAILENLTAEILEVAGAPHLSVRFPDVALTV